MGSILDGLSFGGGQGQPGLLDSLPPWLREAFGGQQQQPQAGPGMQMPVPMPPPRPFAQQPPQGLPQQAPQMPPGGLPPRTPFGEVPKVEGMGSRMYEALGGFLGNEGLIGGGAAAIKTLATGEVTNPYALAKRQQMEEYQGLQRDFSLTEPQARAVMMNPELKKEYAKIAVNPGVTVGPDGTFVQQGPFGKLHVSGGFPVSDRADVVNPDGSRSPGFAIKPSLSNPGGSLVQPQMGLPGGQLRAPGQPAPGIGSRTGGLAANDPTLSVSPRQVITEQSPMIKEEQTATGKDLAGDYTKIRTDATAAQRSLQTLAMMQKLNTRAYEGKAANAQQTLGSVLVSFGMAPEKIRDSVAAGTIFDSLASQMVLASAGGTLGSGVSNADRDYIVQQFPALTQDARGRQELIEYASKLKKREQQILTQADKYRATNGGSMNGFSSHLQQWAEKNPLFPNIPPAANFSDRYQGDAATPGTPGSSSGPVRMTTVEDALKLKPGTRFVDPNGVERVR